MCRIFKENKRVYMLKEMKNFFKNKTILKPYKNNTILYKNFKTYDEMFLTNPYIRRGVNLIANAVSNVDFYFIKNKMKTENEKLQNLFLKPNQFDSWPSFIESIITNYIIYGNAYVYLSVDKDGKLELNVLNSKNTSIAVNKNNIEYLYKDGGESVKITNKSFPYVFHFKIFNPNDCLYGASLLEAIQVSATLQNDIDLHNLSIIQNGGRVSGIITIKDKAGIVSEEAKENLKYNLIEQYKGPGNAGKIAIVSGDVEWVDMGSRAKEMDFSDTSRRAVKGIAACLGVPSILIGESTEGDASKTNMEFIMHNFEKNTILPIVRKLFGFLNTIVEKIDDEYSVDFVSKHEESFHSYQKN